MHERCSLLYSEEQGCFHHDPPQSRGDLRYRLIAQNVLEWKAFCFAQYLHNIYQEDYNFSYDFIKHLWELFAPVNMVDDESWVILDHFLVESLNLVNSEKGLIG